MTITVESDLMTRREAAAYLRWKEQSLAAAACRGDGPPYVKVGRSVRYRKSDLDRWLDARTVTPGLQADGCTR